MSKGDLVERLRGFQKHVMEMDDTQWGIYRSSGGPRICLEAADEIETMRHEIAHRDLTREIQRDIWAKEVELSVLRSQLASAWGKLR
jgi:hypothetical protein